MSGVGALWDCVPRVCGLEGRGVGLCSPCLWCWGGCAGGGVPLAAGGCARAVAVLVWGRCLFSWGFT